MPPFCWNADRFTADVTESLAALLTATRDGGAVARAVAQSAAAADAVCSGREMACAAGCPHCCVLNVAILLPEGMIIAEWIRERLTRSELEAMQKNLRLHRCWTRWMDDEERIQKKMTCPFLDAAGSCSIHPVRPLACRGVASLDSDSCRQALSPGVSDEARLVLADLLRRAAFDAAFTALAQALAQAGIDDRSIELGTGVLAFLEGPEWRERLLGGERLPAELWR